MSCSMVDQTVPVESVQAVAAGRMRYRLPGKVAFGLLASIVVTFLAGSSAPTPLYAAYQTEWHFTPITTTVVFGVYAIAVLVALLVFGRLSDHLGRRPVLLAAILVQIVALVLLAVADGVGVLLLARVVQGLAAGTALGAVGAGLLDLDPRRGAVANSVAPGIGTGSGALLSALAIQFLPAPTHLIYLLLIAVLIVQFGGVLALRETVSRVAGAARSLVPDVQVPARVRRAVLTAAPILFAVWSLAGLYGALGPALVRGMSGSTSVVLGGLGLFVLAGTAAVAVLLLRGQSAHRLAVSGAATLIAGVAATLVAVAAGSLPWFFLATALAGVGFGTGFQGGIRTVVPLVAAHQRAGVLSVLYVVSYLGLGLPAVVAGYLVVHAGGVLPTARAYGLFDIGLAAVALVALLRGRGRG